MNLSEQILELEKELKDFKSGEKYLDLKNKIYQLEEEIENYKCDIQDYEEIFTEIKSLIRRL